MAEARITKVVCPPCKGTGKFGAGLLNTPCMWCRGKIRISVDLARRHADHVYMIAGGGFICGDHDYEHKRKMEQEAERIYALTGGIAPWKSPNVPKERAE